MSNRTFEILTCTAAAISAAIVLSVSACRSQRERVAYLEGRYNLDHASAVALASEK